MNFKCCCLLSTTITGVVILITALVFIPVSKYIIHNEIKQEVSLNKSDTYDNWVKSPVPIYFQVWLWNLTNSAEVGAGGKPTINQIGPYTYSERRQKVNVSFHDNNSTVSYRELKYYTFERDLSIGPETDRFNTINIPMMLIANLVKHELGIIQIAAEAAIEWSKEKLFIDLSVHDILWGYDEPLINKTVTLLDELGFHIKLDDHFGLFATVNGSDDGLYNIFTGNGGTSSKFGVIGNWNYMEKVPYWLTETCNMVNGTDGTIYPPFVDKSDTLYLFSTDICRSIYVQYSRSVTLKDVDLYRFVVPSKVFQNGTYNPANAGYCVTEGLVCLSGLLDVENCKQGAPVIFSQPHFLHADPLVINSVNGVHPNEKEHMTYIDLEPNTGAAFRASKKLQVNVLMQKVKHLVQTEHLHDLAMPILWLNESSIITDKLMDKFKSKLVKPQTIIHVSIYVAIGIGGCLILAVICYMVVKKLMARGDTELVEVTNADERSPLLLPNNHTTSVLRPESILRPEIKPSPLPSVPGGTRSEAVVAENRDLS